jgi:hypothetical protein
MTDGILVEKIGELLCAALYGDLARQKPLSVIDKGSYWRVEGSWNRDGMLEGLAEFFLSIDKSDGRVTDIGEFMRYVPHPSVVPIIDEHLARRRVEAAGAREHEAGSLEANQVEPDRSAAGMLLLTSLARGGVVFSGDLAEKIGSVLCGAHFGDLSRQLPLIAADKDTFWRVEGSWNQDGKAEGPGPFFISIEKFDGRITEMGE